jgi:hypothetical protein
MKDTSQLVEADITAWKGGLKLTLYGSYVTAGGTVFQLKYYALNLTQYERHIRAGRERYAGVLISP